jgi:tetratricopeptide (TPR) repeat protein
VLDNFEAMKDDALMDWVKSVPLPSRVLITSRSEVQHLGRDTCQLPIDGLETEAAIVLLKRYAAATEESIELRGGETALRKIAEVTGGNPQAMRLALGVLQDHRREFEETIATLAALKGDVDGLFNQLFQWAWSVLTFVGEQILLVTALFPSAGSMTVEAIEASSGLNHADFATALQQIRRLGLLTDIGEGRYALHPKTRQFALQKLSAWDKFADGARERCAKYYVKFISDRIVRSRPPVAYWNVLVTDNMKLLDPEWLLIKELMTWAKTCGHGDLLVSFVMLMVHYLDSRFLNQERMEYVLSAIQVMSKLPRFRDEALLRMDALGWTYVEESRWAEAHVEIDAGCLLAERLQDADLVALAHAWKARALIEEGNSEVANAEVALALRDVSLRDPWIRVRIYMAAGDIAHKQQRHSDALEYFNNSLDSAAEYDGEGGGYQIYPRIGMALMSLGNVEEAERKFRALLHLQGIPIANLYGEYGLALVARERYQNKDAEARVQRARKELEDRTSSNLLWKLLKDLQSQLQSGTGTS